MLNDMVFRYFKAKADKGVNICRLGGIRATLYNEIADEGEATAFDFIGIVKFQSTGGTVTRVGKHLLAFRGKLFVNRLKVIIFPYDFATDFDIAFHGNLGRNALYSDGIFKHGVADIVLSTCDSVHQLPILVNKGKPEAVNLVFKFQFGHIVVMHHVGAPLVSLVDTVGV